MPNNGWPTQGNPAYKFADAWAITPYFSVDTKTNPLESLSMDASSNAQIDNINAFFGDSKNPGLIRNISRNQKLGVYN